MKRILIFSLAYHPFVGGAELAIKEITDRIPREAYEFDMITLRFDRALPKTERVGNVTVHRIGMAAEAPRVSDRALPATLRISKFFFPLAALRKAMSLHKAKPFHCTWAMMANHAGFAALFFKLLRPETPFFLELQDGRPFSEMRKRRRLLVPLWSLYRLLFLKADRIKTISSYIANEVRALGYRKPIEIIPNGVDATRFSALAARNKILELKQKCGKRAGDVFLFTASRLVLSRGVEDIIRALPLLPANVKLLIAGDGEDRKKLENMARRLDISNRVLFAGQVSHEELPALLHISDIFVRPSIIEGFGSAFVEAFAAGIPVIATPVGGIPDFLFDPGKNPDKKPTGLFCEVRNPGSIARAVKRYVSEPALAARVVKNAHELVVRKYDWEIIARDMRKKIFAPLTP